MSHNEFIKSLEFANHHLNMRGEKSQLPNAEYNNGIKDQGYDIFVENKGPMIKHVFLNIFHCLLPANMCSRKTLLCHHFSAGLCELSLSSLSLDKDLDVLADQ